MENYKSMVMHYMIDSNVRSFTELAKLVHEKTGLYCDHAYMSRILNGERKAPKIRAAIAEILQLPEEVRDAET